MVVSGFACALVVVVIDIWTGGHRLSHVVGWLLGGDHDNRPYMAGSGAARDNV